MATTTVPSFSTIDRTENASRIARVAFGLSTALASVAAITATLGLVFPTVFHDPPMTVGNIRGTAAVVLFVAVPLLVGAMVVAARGGWRAQIVWLGSLAYLLYNGVLFCFMVKFNSLFLGFVAMLSLALWSLVALLRSVDVRWLRASFSPRVPARALAIYLAGCAGFFALAWLADIVPAMMANTSPGSYQGTIILTNAVHIVDLACTLPLMIVAAVWLWQRKAWGYVLAGTMLVMLAIETLSIAVDQVFGRLHDPSVPLTAAQLMIELTVVGIIAVALLLRPPGNPALARSERPNDRS